MTLQPGFTEAWFGPMSQMALEDQARSIVDVAGEVIEIGSWEGCSSVVLANAVHPRTLHCVDTWQGSPNEVSAELAAERDVFAQFQVNVGYWTQGNIETHRMGWRDYMPTVSGPVALCFIDAQHTYDEVYENIAVVRPLLARGGVVCGDDIGHGPVRAAVAHHFGFHDVWVHGNVWSWRQP